MKRFGTHQQHIQIELKPSFAEHWLHVGQVPNISNNAKGSFSSRSPFHRVGSKNRATASGKGKRKNVNTPCRVDSPSLESALYHLHTHTHRDTYTPGVKKETVRPSLLCHRTGNQASASCGTISLFPQSILLWEKLGKVGCVAAGK